MLKVTCCRCSPRYNGGLSYQSPSQPLDINPWSHEEELLMDGETGVATSALAGSFLSRLGIKCIPRAPQQHARIVERRGALLRDVIHRIDAQLKIEGLLDIPFEYRLAEAVFA